MTPGNIRTLALKAAGFTSDPDAAAAGRGAVNLVNRIEEALQEVRAVTVEEASRLAGTCTEAAERIRQLLPEATS